MEFQVYALENFADIAEAALSVSHMPTVLYAICLPVMSPEGAKALRPHLSGPNVEAVCSGSNNPRFPDTQPMKDTLTYFCQQGWISNYEHSLWESIRFKRRKRN